MSLGSAQKRLSQEKRAAAPSYRVSRTLWAASKPYLLAGLCILLLAAGALLRFQSIDWDEGQHLHPDERFLTMVATGIQWPRSLGEYFDTARSPLNPYNAGFSSFVYGTFPLFLAKAVGGVLGKGDYFTVHLVGRALSGVMDLISVVFLFLIGRKLYNARVGLLAAALLTFTVFNIQQSHFFTADMPANLMVVIAMFFAIQVSRGGRWLNFLGLGIAFGLAVASKINLALFALVIVLACVQRFLLPYLSRLAAPPPAPADAPVTANKKKGKGRSARQAAEEPASSSQGSLIAAAANLRKPVWNMVVAGALVLLVAVLAFRIAQPYAFSGPGFFGLTPNPQWVEDLRSTGRIVSGEGDYPAGHQWAFRTTYLFPWINIVQWGMGWGLGLSAWAGVGLAVWELAARRKSEHLLVVAWILAQFFVQGGGFVLTMRYFLPIYPFLALMAAYLLVWLWERSAGRERFSRLRIPLQPLAGALVALVVLSTVLWAVAFSAVYRQPVSRVTASRWIYANIPKGTTYGWEHWDDALPLRVDGKDIAGYYNTVELPLYAEDTPEKLYGYEGQPDSGLLDKLDQVEWIFISSARLYTSIPRLPMRFPMTTKYYEALFSGELGFERVQTFTNFPALGPWEIDDQGAEEQFTVYDHPRVDLFRKTPAYSRERAGQILGDVDWDSIQRLTARNATRVPGGLLLSPQDRAVQQAGGTWAEMFNRSALANQSDLAAFFTWLLALELVSLAVLPLALLAFGGLADRGYLLAKPLGLLLVSYLAWLAASITPLPFTRLTVLLALALVGTAGGLIWALQPSGLANYFQTHKRLIIVEEIVFLVFLTAFVLIRRENPDLWRPWTGGEKPMDFAYLNAILKNTHFPPYDPWFAGGYLNYYYMGFVQVASLIKLTGIVPWIAYNLSLPTLFAMTATGAFSVVYTLTHRAEQPVFSWRSAGYAATGAMFVAVLGNLGEVRLLWRALRELGAASASTGSALMDGVLSFLAGLTLWSQGKELPIRLDWWYWNATRVLPGNEIQEFPFFSFLFGDLHAHVMALPLTLLALNGIVNLLFLPRAAPEPAGRGFWRGQPLLSLTLLALSIGVLKPANTWDFPTYLLLAFAALAAWGFANRSNFDLPAVGMGMVVFVLVLRFVFGLEPAFSLALGLVVGGVYGWIAGRRAVLAAAFVAFVSLLLFLPFESAYATPYSSAELWKGDRTSLVDYLTIHGVFLLVIGAYLSVEWARWLQSRPERQPTGAQGSWGRAAAWARSRSGLRGISLVGLFALAAAGLYLFQLPAAAITLPLSVLAGLLLLRSEMPVFQRFLLLLILTGLLLTLMVELVVLKGDIGRSNTMFKFYLQVWVLWGCAAAAALPQIHSFLRGRPRLLRWGWSAGLAALIAGAALYPLLATPAHLRDRLDPKLPPTLNGMVFLKSGIYGETDASGAPVAIELAFDHDALVWMQDHISGSPVVAEANSPHLYHWTGRVSVWTGLPTVLGYNWHQKQQRAATGGDFVDRREQQANRLFQTTDIVETTELVRRYGVQYIYVGALERAFYPAAGIEKFDALSDQWLEIVYENPQVRIYRVDPSRMP